MEARLAGPPGEVKESEAWTYQKFRGNCWKLLKARIKDFRSDMKAIRRLYSSLFWTKNDQNNILEFYSNKYVLMSKFIVLNIRL